MLAVLVVLKRIFPVPIPPSDGRSMDELGAEYGGWERFQSVLFLALMVLSTCGWFALIDSVTPTGGFRLDEQTFVLRPPRIAWGLPAIFLGILTGGMLTSLVLSQLLAGRYREFAEFVYRKAGISQAIEKPVIALTVGFAAILTLLIVDSYAVFTPSEIRFDAFLSFREHRFDYVDIVDIRTAPIKFAPSGAAVHSREYLIRFADSSSWNTNFEPSEATDEQKRLLVETISSRSGVPIDEVPSFRAGDFW